MSRADDDFAEYARASAGQLRRTAYLLCRDWDLAADLTQTTLVRMFTHWQRITRRDNPHAYARQVLSRAFLDHHRSKRSQEVVTAEILDLPVGTVTSQSARSPARLRRLLGRSAGSTPENSLFA